MEETTGTGMRGGGGTGTSTGRRKSPPARPEGRTRNGWQGRGTSGLFFGASRMVIAVTAVIGYLVYIRSNNEYNHNIFELGDDPASQPFLPASKERILHDWRLSKSALLYPALHCPCLPGYFVVQHVLYRFEGYVL